MQRSALQEDISADLPDEKVDNPEIDPLWDSAHFLLQATEEHSLTHDGVESLCNTVQLYVKRVCQKISEKVDGQLKCR